MLYLQSEVVMNLSFYFILYIIYSFLGWLLEVINIYIRQKKFVNRGFLIGPYCPIYGKGAILVIILLTRYLEEPLTLFILSIVICSVIEYFGSYILEKIFKTSWWDYSNRKYNLNGRICLETMIPFGICCLFVIYGLNPVLTRLLNMIPDHILNILAICLFIGYLVDFVISFNIILKFKKISNDLRKDSTEKVTEFVKNEIIKRKSKLQIRLIKAFPSLKVIRNIIKREEE